MSHFETTARQQCWGASSEDYTMLMTGLEAFLTSRFLSVIGNLPVST
jgi:hypothetical protein